MSRFVSSDLLSYIGPKTAPQSIKKFGEAVAGFTAQVRAYRVDGFGWGSRHETSLDTDGTNLEPGSTPCAPHHKRGYTTLCYTRLFLGALETCYCSCFDHVLFGDLLQILPDQGDHCKILKEQHGKELRKCFAPLPVTMLSCWTCIFHRDPQLKIMVSQKVPASLEDARDSFQSLQKGERLDALCSSFCPDAGEVFLPEKA